MIKVKKLYNNSKLPTRGHPSDAGLDLYYVGPDITITSTSRAVLPTGIAMAIPEGHVGLIWPRSGLAVKSGIDVLAGVIDSLYRGEIKVALINLGGETITINHGDKIAQIIIQTVKLNALVEVETLDATVRGEAGFGSTGK